MLLKSSQDPQKSYPKPKDSESLGRIKESRLEKPQTTKSAGLVSPASDPSAQYKVADKFAQALKIHYFRTVFEPRVEDAEGELGEEESVKKNSCQSIIRTHKGAEKFLFGDNVEGIHFR